MKNYTNARLTSHGDAVRMTLGSHSAVSIDQGGTSIQKKAVGQASTNADSSSTTGL